VKPSVIRGEATITCVNFSDYENQLCNDDIYIGDDATAFLLHLVESDGFDSSDFFAHARSFYEIFSEVIG